MDSYALMNFSRPDLELFIARNYIDAATRVSLEKILDLKSRMTLTDSRIESIDIPAQWELRVPLAPTNPGVRREKQNH
jgi:tRNA(Phe) wybutosine-synthesizing methylase Tyw3